MCQQRINLHSKVANNVKQQFERYQRYNVRRGWDYVSVQQQRTWSKQLWCNGWTMRGNYFLILCFQWSVNLILMWTHGNLVLKRYEVPIIPKPEDKLGLLEEKTHTYSTDDQSCLLLPNFSFMNISRMNRISRHENFL